MFVRIAAVAMTAIATLAAAAPAAAQDFTPRTATVAYGDLDLASTAGQDRLGARISKAAAYVCGPHTVDLRVNRAVDGCRADVTADARGQLATVVAGRDTGRAGALVLAAR